MRDHGKATAASARDRAIDELAKAFGKERWVELESIETALKEESHAP